MSFQFSSFHDFMWMDGHGPFVWACYGATLLGFVYLALAPKLRRRRFVREQSAIQQRTTRRPPAKITE